MSPGIEERLFNGGEKTFNKGWDNHEKERRYKQSDHKECFPDGGLFISWADIHFHEPGLCLAAADNDYCGHADPRCENQVGLFNQKNNYSASNYYLEAVDKQKPSEFWFNPLVSSQIAKTRCVDYAVLERKILGYLGR